MQIKFLKQIVEHVAGEPATQIVDLLSDKKDVNEFVIAKKLGLTINQTRNLLYRLSHLGILSSIRKKDKRKGWYIYFWTLNTLRSLEILENKLEEELANLEVEFKHKKSKRFYKCKICGIEITEENALVQDFECPECGEIYVLSDTGPHVQSVAKAISRHKKELDFIAQERGKEQLKKDKKLTRQIKKDEKEKKAIRHKKAKLRKAKKKRDTKKEDAVKSLRNALQKKRRDKNKKLGKNKNKKKKAKKK
jgi:transcription factor E